MRASALTRSFSPLRDGANLNESVLTAIRVQKQGIRHLFDCHLPGDARGTEGMPLVVPDLTFPNGRVRDVLFVASMSNDVRAFDASTGELLWQRRVANPVDPTDLDVHHINDHWGILSTPVIDVDKQVLYAVAQSSPNGDVHSSQLALHALRLTDGSNDAPAFDLSPISYTAPGLTRTAKFGSVARKQRCGLLLDKRNGVDTVFIATGSFSEDLDTNQGWVIACDVSGPAIAFGAAWTTTSKFTGGGIWMGGQGPSMDDAGHVYAMTGNGAFDGITDFGESFFKLKYVPPKNGAAGSITIVDWFTPFTDTGRVGGDPTLADVTLIPGNTPKPGGGTSMDDPGDEDLNSGGPLLLPKSLTGFDRNVIIGAGKDGIAYVVDMDNMGKTALADFAPSKIKGNYAKLLSPPYGFTYYPFGMDLAPTDLSTLQTTYGFYTHHQHSTPIFYKSPRFGCMLFTGGENGPVRAFRLNNDFTLEYLGAGEVIASAGMAPPGGMPGTMMTLSANGQVEDTAVLWCLNPYGDANTDNNTGGRLVAYGADWIDNQRLVKIWDSADWGIAFPHNKFNVPACVNGKVYVPTYDARVKVFG